jgi:hypothetical protein
MAEQDRIDSDTRASELLALGSALGVHRWVRL